jgi:hypothetical protein
MQARSVQREYCGHIEESQVFCLTDYKIHSGNLVSNCNDGQIQIQCTFPTIRKQ